MCGIAGFVNRDGSPASADLIQAMTDAIAHRGPDGEGAHLSGPVALGNRRLAILDLSDRALQPLHNEDRTVWLTFNGEIYNYRSLRSELIDLGHRFTSSSDSEVVVHAYEQWGTESVHRFRGMFAFAIWDEAHRRLWVVRDRLGIKPLFYAATTSRFLFGSEIKAILADPLFERRIDTSALPLYTGLNYTPAPHTLFDGIRQLLPGHTLTLQSDGRLVDHEYWNLRFESREQSVSTWTAEFRSMLDESVQIHLESDVPVGVFLSAGIDSAAIASYATKHVEDALPAFTASFDESEFDEAHLAAATSSMLGARHLTTRISEDLESLLEQVVWHAEEPTADSSMIAVWEVSRLAAKHVKVVLSGEGADELLAGYETYQAHYLRRLYRMIPESLRKSLIQPMVNSLPASHGKVPLEEKLKRFVAGSELDEDAAHASWRIIFDPESRRRLLRPSLGGDQGSDAVADLYREYFDRVRNETPLHRMLYVDTRLYLPNDMLVKMDRMTMAHGIEGRVPFLDHRLVEMIAAMPPELKLRKLYRRKYILRRAMKGSLPRAVLRGRKRGFNVPNARWIRGKLEPYVRDSLSGSRVRALGFLDEAFVELLLDEHFRKIADHSHRIWGLLVLMIWWRLFMEPPRSSR
ncbi:MAG: asparagine synthase (glutamine-hydrolyzing) [Acidobacteria bacterium]|nr:asparagine synthase (glutamine-hydrolyzing) [Acidobacteriota bacterium]